MGDFVSGGVGCAAVVGACVTGSGVEGAGVVKGVTTGPDVVDGGKAGAGVVEGVTIGPAVVDGGEAGAGVKAGKGVAGFNRAMQLQSPSHWQSWQRPQMSRQSQLLSQSQ